jgi:peptide/nickel transport system permease protein
LRQRRTIDRAIVGFSVAGASAPAFVTGLLLLYVFAVQLGWFSVSGPGTSGLDRLWHLTLPAFALALTDMALIVKLTRAGMIRSLGEDYVEFARARGIAERRVITHYALRNGLIPVVTAGGLLLGYTLTGAVLVEFTFGLPGIGSLLVNAVNTKDVPVVQGVAIILAILIVLVNALTDVLYRVVDPRVQFESAS